MRSARHGQVQAHIDAPPQQVWALLANLDQMGRWSPECYRVQWLDGASSPATPGARFKGWNRFGWMRWTMTCQVKTAEPGRELAFSTIQRERELVPLALSSRADRRRHRPHRVIPGHLAALHRTAR